MDRAETLKRIKEAEEEVLALRKEVETERDRIMKEARRAEIDLQDSLRKQGEERRDEVIADAMQAAAREREAILERGRAESSKVKSEGMKNFEKAVSWLVEKFKGAVNA